MVVESFYLCGGSNMSMINAKVVWNGNSIQILLVWTHQFGFPLSLDLLLLSNLASMSSFVSFLLVICNLLNLVPIFLFLYKFFFFGSSNIKVVIMELKH